MCLKRQHNIPKFWEKSLAIYWNVVKIFDQMPPKLYAETQQNTRL